MNDFTWIDDIDEDDIKWSPAFNIKHCGNPTVRSGDIVEILRWNLKGKAIGHPYIYLGEECVDVRLESGTILDELPVTAIGWSRERDRQTETVEVRFHDTELCASLDDGEGEGRMFGSLYMESDDFDVSQQAGIPDLMECL